MRIHDEDCSVRMLQIHDFDIGRVPDEINILPQDCLLARDPSIQLRLAEMCVEKARLSRIISNTLKTQYTVSDRDNIRPGDTENSSVMLFPKDQDKGGDVIAQLDNDLTVWEGHLPITCRLGPACSLSPDESPVVALQLSLLHMIYQSTISALHRPRFSFPASEQLAAPKPQLHSRQRVQQSAVAVTQIVFHLRSRKLEKFLPTSGVTALLPTMLMHLWGYKNHDPEQPLWGVRGYRVCRAVLETLRESYASADFAINFIDAFLLKMGMVDNGVGFQPAHMTGFGQGTITQEQLRMKAQVPQPRIPTSPVTNMLTPQASTPSQAGDDQLGVLMADLADNNDVEMASTVTEPRAPESLGGIGSSKRDEGVGLPTVDGFLNEYVFGDGTLAPAQTMLSGEDGLGFDLEAILGKQGDNTGGEGQDLFPTTDELAWTNMQMDWGDGE